MPDFVIPPGMLSIIFTFLSKGAAANYKLILLLPFEPKLKKNLKKTKKIQKLLTKRVHVSIYRNMKTNRYIAILIQTTSSIIWWWHNT